MNINKVRGFLSPPKYKIGDQVCIGVVKDYQVGAASQWEYKVLKDEDGLMTDWMYEDQIEPLAKKSFLSKVKKFFSDLFYNSNV